MYNIVQRIVRKAGFAIQQRHYVERSRTTKSVADDVKSVLLNPFSIPSTRRRSKRKSDQVANGQVGSAEVLLQVLENTVRYLSLDDMRRLGRVSRPFRRASLSLERLVKSLAADATTLKKADSLKVVLAGSHFSHLFRVKLNLWEENVFKSWRSVCISSVTLLEVVIVRKSKVNNPAQRTVRYLQLVFPNILNFFVARGLFSSSVFGRHHAVREAADHVVHFYKFRTSRSVQPTFLTPNDLLRFPFPPRRSSEDGTASAALPKKLASPNPCEWSENDLPLEEDILVESVRVAEHIMDLEGTTRVLLDDVEFPFPRILRSGYRNERNC